MSLLFADSFDHYGDDEGNLVLGPGAYGSISSTTFVNLSSTRKRTGDRSLRVSTDQNAPANFIVKPIVLSTNEVIFGIGLYMDSLPASDNKVVFGYTGASNFICRIAITTTGSISVFAGSSTLVATTDNIIGAGTFNYIEFRVLRDNVVGEAEVRLNGITVASATGLNLGTVDIDTWRFTATSNGSGCMCYIDDLYIVDTGGTANNDFLGPVRINTIFATSDTATADWSKNTGSDGYALIDEVPPDGDTTYLQSNTLDQTSEFGLGTLPAEVVSVNGIYIPTMGKLADAGIGNVTTSLVSGASASVGPDTPFTTNYAYYGSAHDLNPDGNIPWTKASVEAAKLRIKKTL